MITGLVNADNLVKPHNNLVNCLMRGAVEGLCRSGGGGDKAVGSSGQHSSRRMNEPATFWSAFIPDRPLPHQVYTGSVLFIAHLSWPSLFYCL